MSNSKITIEITRDSDEQVKTTVINEAGDDPTLQLMSGVIKVFLSDSQALETYAHFVRSHLETQSKLKEDDSNDE